MALDKRVLVIGLDGKCSNMKDVISESDFSASQNSILAKLAKQASQPK